MKTETVGQIINLTDEISKAANCINQLYPLTSFVACNALKGYEQIPFDEAMRKAKEMFQARGYLPLSEYRAMYETGRIAPADLTEAFIRNRKLSRRDVPSDRTKLCISEMFDLSCNTRIVETINKQMIKWCGAYLDQTQAQWSPVEKRSLYSFWKQLARHDKSLWWQGIRNFGSTIAALPDNAETALELQLQNLDIEGENIAPYLRSHLIQLPGFASYLKWKDAQSQGNELLLDFLAIRLHYESVLSKYHAGRLYKSQDLGIIRSLLESECSITRTFNSETDEDYAAIWQEAYELNYRNELLYQLNPHFTEESGDSQCQLVFCIDVRSEPIRREIEKRGPYGTYGFAGFFGMPFQLKEVGSEMPLDLCPVLIKPDKNVRETGQGDLIKRKTSWQALKASALQLKKKLKSNIASAFGLVDLIGLYSAIPLAVKTFFPSQTQRFLDAAERLVEGEVKTQLDLSHFSLQEKINLAEGAVAGIGLKNFSKVIVLCGHKSSSVNNPFASSLDCGACGGNGGLYNARFAAEILNDKDVRAALALKNTLIPDDTVFIAAQHDTTTDEISLLRPETLNDEQTRIIQELEADLEHAGQAAREARLRLLPSSNLAKLNHPFERACDWAQVAPEWGLAGNAAFIAAPRTVSAGADLKGRVFLHSYDCALDKENKALELIMTAPLVVAQWINTQYYLSTVDNEKFGSGTKVIHNVVGDFGVMSGSESDLRLGLPLQSISADDELRHEPMRLLSVIRAKRSAIEKVLAKHHEVDQLVKNRWIRLVALEPEEQRFYELCSDGEWQLIEFKQGGDKPGASELANAATVFLGRLLENPKNATPISRQNRIADHEA
jgi:hypothetical protein